jgi:putative tricarboxylic transport membrane protein
MEVWQSLAHGFGVALSPGNLFFAFVGAVVGTITGILPGIGPLGAMAILLSFTLYMDATTAMIFFAGIYYGAMYGGSTTSILLRIPGEAASVVTCLDGYEMAKKGRAGAALTVSAVGSFVAGNISILGLMVAAPLLGKVALKFGPPEFVAIGVCGLTLLVRLEEGSVLQSTIMILLGFTLHSEQLAQGLDLLPVAMGLFGIAEVLDTATREQGESRVIRVKLRELFPSRREWKRSVSPIFRGSFLGFLIGLIPGPSPVISTFVSYVTEKKLSKHPEEFGKGAIEGVAGPESANNSAVGGAYVPLMALGIPFTPAMAMVLGALMLHNITPGPNMIQQKPDLFWGVIAAMYIGNFMLVLLNLPMVNLFVGILRIPKPILFPIIVLLCLVGVYSVNASYVDLFAMALFGVIGYALREVGFKPAPLILAMVIGPMIENSLRQALLISGGELAPLVLRPICLTLYSVALCGVVVPWVLKKWKSGRSRPAIPLTGNK